MRTEKCQVPSHVMLTVKRPGGEIEVVKYAAQDEISPVRFKMIQEATRKAGKGEVLSYENVKKDSTITWTDADLATESTVKIEKMMAYGE